MATVRVNNDVYRRLGHAWWDDEVGEFSTIRFWVNPVRFGYFERVLDQERVLGRGMRKLLDVGCGGGLLAEEFARCEFPARAYRDVPGEAPRGPRSRPKRAYLDVRGQVRCPIGQDRPDEGPYRDVPGSWNRAKDRFAVSEPHRATGSSARATRRVAPMEIGTVRTGSKRTRHGPMTLSISSANGMLA
jgi:hypothetical protein